MTEVVRYVRPDAPLVNPATAEVVHLDAPTNELARARDEVTQIEGMLREFKRALDRELVNRFDDDNSKSAKVGDWSLKVDPAYVWTTDAKPLRDELLKLVDKGHLSLKAVDEALKVERSVKVNRVKLRALHEHPDDAVREVVGVYDRRVRNEQRRVSVSVSR